MSKHRLIGTYHLVSWENRYASGKVAYPFGADAQGYISYSLDGYMFVHIMANHRKLHTGDDLFDGDIHEIQKSATTHLSYSGRYELQDNEIIHHVSICSFPNWVNTEQRREWRFQNGQLLLIARDIVSGKEKVDAYLIWHPIMTRYKGPGLG